MMLVCWFHVSALIVNPDTGHLSVHALVILEESRLAGEALQCQGAPRWSEPLVVGGFL